MAKVTYQHGVLLSIKEKYLKMIEAGVKTIEFRKKFPAIPHGTKVYLVCNGHVHGRFYFRSMGYRMAAYSYDANVKLGIKPGISHDDLIAYAGGPERLILEIPIDIYEKIKTPIPIKRFGRERSPQNYCSATRLPIDLPKLD